MISLIRLVRESCRRRRFTVSVAARRGVTLIAFAMGAAVFLLVTTASAAIVPTVPLGTSANYAVLAGQTVTNTGATTLDGSLGLSPKTSVTGFPPGLVVPPGTKEIANPAAAKAQSDLTAAYVNAAGRPVTTRLAASISAADTSPHSPNPTRPDFVLSRSTQ